MPADLAAHSLSGKGPEPPEDVRVSPWGVPAIPALHKHTACLFSEDKLGAFVQCPRFTQSSQDKESPICYLGQHYGLNDVFPAHPLPPVHVEALTPAPQHVTVFGDKVFKEVIKYR